jgi:hypothetical protein
VQQLQQENTILRMDNENTINAKLVELENRVQEETRQKHALHTQLEVSQERCRKMEMESETLKLDI